MKRSTSDMPPPEKGTSGMPPPSLMLQECSYVLKEYSLGEFLIPLEDMACLPLNRDYTGVSGHHAHSLMERCNEQEGYADWRFRRGLCLEPNPADPLENARWTNAYVAKQRDLLCPVAMRALPGSFSHTHFWHGSFTMKAGTFKYYGKDKPFTPNPSDHGFANVLKHGLRYEKLRYEALLHHKCALQKLMQGENFDAAYSMAQTEMALIASYFKTCSLAVPKPQQTHWDAVCEAIDGQIGNAWSSHAKAATYNLACVLGEAHVQMLVDAYQYYVDPKCFELGASKIEAVANLPAAYGWSKTAVLLRELTTTNLVVASGSKSRGNAISETALKAISKISVLKQVFWKEFESQIRKVMTGYTAALVPGVDSHSLLKGQSAFLSRCGDALGKLKPSEDPAEQEKRTFAALNAVRSAESKLRQFLSHKSSTVQLPDRMLPEQEVDPKEEQKNQKELDKTKTKASLSFAPVVYNAKGEAVEDNLLKARDLGMAVGSSVMHTAPRSGNTELAEIIELSSKLVKIRLEKNGSEKTVKITELCLPAKEKKQNPEKSKSEAAAPDERQPAEEWQHIPESLLIGIIESLVSCALFQIQAKCTPDSSVVRVHTEGGLQVMSMEKEAKASTLAFIPFTGSIKAKEAKPPAGKRSKTSPPLYIKATLKDSPAKDFHYFQAEPCDTLFWKLLDANTTHHRSRSKAAATLTWEIAKIDVPLKAVPANKVKCLSNASKPFTLTLEIPYLTNEHDLVVGSVLTIPSGPPPDPA
jgi:hypothetical protein